MIRWIIIGMALVTYIPRLLPLYFLANKKLNPKLEEFLNYIPYTSLSILLARGVMTSSNELIFPTTVGITLAGLVSYYRPNLVVSVLISIIGSFIIINI